MNTTNILQALTWRYAVKTFDPSKKVSDADLHTILEAGRMAPSSVGLEPWKFIVITNPEIRAKLRAAAYDQTKVTDASHIVVIARRTDVANLSPELIARTSKTQSKAPEDLAGLKGMADGSIGAHSSDPRVLDGWIAAQTYIPLGIMVEAAALMGIDTCPMEGFDPTQVDTILGLKAKNLASTTLFAIGYRGADPYAAAPKTRRGFDDVVEFMH